ncbi:deoxyguanosinetriphosphate triphosphohydrolase [Vandammella animalimorsus]|uniref:Deoxyguanosinetriphosphate triphosphohydrolase-like protein n=1 Tax=Vandammella animalimorsus TaxID=2029117 RepID=A0A2A2AFH8_9BURK|nr:deoxyguanosinetriphosphate triphosphohydrolase [Vandammella animalimorsus]PAT37310.1 deoxyguanosinetriphosphate triphosphohydrolase [Vandammella animalimorsus]
MSSAPASARHAPYACQPAHTRGRRVAEAAAPTRSDFQRDRDRIVHSSAFRRLVYKTQVFLNHEGDMFRTRLTHSLEVAQVARSIARPLGLDEDLVEAIALAHDLGHTPFGHAGQDALHACMRDFGGFEHNLQSLRVVDVLEQRYPQFDGLNLCFETREGILKHCSARNARAIEAREPGGIARRFLDAQWPSPSLEAQLCNLADSIAYNAHDIDDGIRSGLLQAEQLQEVALFAQHHAQAADEFPALRQQPRRWLYETIRRMLSAQIYDVIDTTGAHLAQHRPASADAVRQLPPLLRFSEAMQRQAVQLKQALFEHLYRHPQVQQTTERAQQVITDLFQHYLAAPERMPPEFAARAQQAGSDAGAARSVADFIAGMTDRFALAEHERLHGYAIMQC